MSGEAAGVIATLLWLFVTLVAVGWGIANLLATKTWGPRCATCKTNQRVPHRCTGLGLALYDQVKKVKL